MTSSDFLFTFNVPKKLKDEVIDHLMNSELASGFSLTSIMGYSNEHSSFSLDEQVRGYKNLFQFEVLVSEEKLTELKANLAKTFSTVKIRYWVTPIIESGHL